ncbi:Ubiquitin fusion degradation protein UFD1 [Macrophomina phaseolina MS6]|uniref:Ubiquitin fusion degradation protein 1 n=2 Tax=Macrophomina phaseolina TaxID=35725 RepID=K2QJ48_MACPH|nr:Ubiquitin fusion degradation protein UFD1 [Macrophomina phaseolina MS6]KAH7059080.1 ubiquitin fusion degradation protein [Macrophomina phaseolina]
MFGGNYYDNDDPMTMYQAAMGMRGGQPRRFDEYFRCYPVAMMPGPEREEANHGGKAFLPPSALDKLTRLHITYPMLFELTNGTDGKRTHAGVLEFTAEEGKIYLPYWLMQTLSLEPGDLVQVKSTDLPLGNFIKLQPQSPAFLDISDPKAVLEQAFRNFSCLTVGDIFTFAYNDQVYSIKVLEVKPDKESHAICTLETDLSVDFAPPVGYEEPPRAVPPSGTSTPRSAASGATGATLPGGGMLHSQGTMAQAINYAAIAPSSTTAAAGAKAVSSNFLAGGHKLSSSKRGSKAPTPKPSTPVAGASSNAANAAPVVRRSTNGPQPLRLPPGKLFFGYEIKPVKGKEAKEGGADDKPHFQGQGQTLRGKKK